MDRMSRVVIAAALQLALLAPVPAAEPGADALTADLATARARCDLEAAVVAQTRLRELGAARPGADSAMLLARADLLVAELLRVDLERLAEDQREARTALGQRIDAAAEEGLGLLERLPESSEQQRLRADLLATMIRSKLRARRFEAQLIAAADRAIELDPGNPHALVARGKPLVFAGPEHGGDPAAAVALLDRALDLDPQLDSALLLRSLAYDLLGDETAAAHDRAVLARLRPDCPPPQSSLGRVALQ